MYDAYGNLVASSVVVANVYLYCGEQFDPDLGFYYLRARYMDPNSGRFWTRDTDEGDQEDPLSIHKYLYCEGNPINGRDPSGHELLTAIAVAITIGAIADTAVYFGYKHYLNSQIEDQEVKVAIAGAKFYTKRAIRRLNRWNPSDQTDYITWFGAIDAGRKTVVQNCLASILVDLNNPITWHKTNEDVYAYCYPGGPVEIWFGPYFWNAPDLGTDSKAGTVVHELSHEVQVTVDTDRNGAKVYGTTASKALANSDPDQAVHHADSYEYFAEEAQ